MPPAANMSANPPAPLSTPIAGEVQGEHLQPRSASAWVVNPELEGGQRRIKFRKVRPGWGWSWVGCADRVSGRTHGHFEVMLCALCCLCVMHSTRVPQVTAGLGHCLGVLADGGVTAWGWNAAGQCGLGQFVTAESIQVPTAIYGIPNNRWALSATGQLTGRLST